MLLYTPCGCELVVLDWDDDDFDDDYLENDCDCDCTVARLQDCATFFVSFALLASIAGTSTAHIEHTLSRFVLW